LRDCSVRQVEGQDPPRLRFRNRVDMDLTFHALVELPRFRGHGG
jgi:hypothetical protein